MIKKMTCLSNLERIRKEKQLSRRELELLSGVKQLTIHHLETGTTNVNDVKLSTLIKLAKALKVKVIDLLDKDLQRFIR